MEPRTIDGMTRAVEFEALDRSSKTGFHVGPYLVKDQIWGLKDGVYAPIGNLQLPVQLEYWRFGSNTDPQVFAMTVFDNKFYQGEIPEYKQDNWNGPMSGSLMGHSWREKLGIKSDRHLTISENQGSLDYVMQRHIAGFFARYNRIKSNGDAKSARDKLIKNSFTEYQ